MKRILDKSFVYRPSHATNLAETFERERDRLKALKDAQDANQSEAAQKTVQLPQRKQA